MKYFDIYIWIRIRKNWVYLTGFVQLKSSILRDDREFMKTIAILIIAYVGFVWLIARWLRLASRPDRQLRHEEFAQEPTEPAVTSTLQKPPSVEGPQLH